MKTRKIRKSKIKNAICVIHNNEKNISGFIKFSQSRRRVKIEYEIKGLSDGKHGFHIHEYGDLTDGCMSSCSHFNPFNKKHGGLKRRKDMLEI